MDCMRLKSLVLASVLLVAMSVSALAQQTPVQVTGVVDNPLPLTLKSARELWPFSVQKIAYQIKDREEEGYAISLLNVLDAARVKLPKDDNHAELNYVVVAVGSDGYTAVLSFGEILPEVGQNPVFIVWSKDGQKVRLLTPNDLKPSRSVYDLTELRVIRVGD